MATTFDSDEYSGQAVAMHNRDITRASQYEISAALVINDVIRFFKVPKNAKLLDAVIQCDDLDSHATPTIVMSLQLSDGSTHRDLIDASTVGQAGGLIRPAKTPALEPAINFIVPDDDYYIRLLVNTAPATGAATGTIECQVRYTMDLPNEDV